MIPSVTLAEIERLITRAAGRMYDRGLVSGHWGNITAITPDGSLLGTPQGLCLKDVTAGDLVQMDRNGVKIGGRGRPFFEIAMHIAVYRERPDIGAVVHAHPPAATTFACAGLPIDGRFSPEFTFMTGGVVPVVPFAMPGSRTLDNNLAPFFEKHDAVMLENHGILAWGPCPVTALMLIEQVEEIARIMLNSNQVGKISPLPEEVVGLIVDARTRAGRGPAGRERKTVRGR